MVLALGPFSIVRCMPFTALFFLQLSLTPDIHLFTNSLLIAFPLPSFPFSVFVFSLDFIFFSKFSNFFRWHVHTSIECDWKIWTVNSISTAFQQQYVPNSTFYSCTYIWILVHFPQYICWGVLLIATNFETVNKRPFEIRFHTLYNKTLYSNIPFIFILWHFNTSQSNSGWYMDLWSEFLTQKHVVRKEVFKERTRERDGEREREGEIERKRKKETGLEIKKKNLKSNKSYAHAHTHTRIHQNIQCPNQKGDSKAI